MKTQFKTKENNLTSHNSQNNSPDHINTLKLVINLRISHGSKRNKDIVFSTKLSHTAVIFMLVTIFVLDFGDGNKVLNEGGNLYIEDFKAPGGPKFNNGRMYSIFTLS